MTWVQLLRTQQIEKGGISRTYYPGDWVDVGKQTAQRWVIDGAARFASPQTAVSLDGCGMVTLGSYRQPEAPVPVEHADAPTLCFARTLLAGGKVRPELLGVGFGLLNTWEVVAPLCDYDRLASHVGTPDARRRTAEQMGDLRVPLYESRMVFVRRCRNGEALIEAWNAERASGDDERLCFLRALWQVKPLICATPVTWHQSA